MFCNKTLTAYKGWNNDYLVSHLTTQLTSNNYLNIYALL